MWRERTVVIESRFGKAAVAVGSADCSRDCRVEGPGGAPFWGRPTLRSPTVSISQLPPVAAIPALGRFREASLWVERRGEDCACGDRRRNYRPGSAG